VIRVDAQTLVLRMNDCRVQSARERRGLATFPCKAVGQVEYPGFARAIDPRIGTRCLWRPDPTARTELRTPAAALASLDEE